jgi:hypothetical protein
MRWGKVVACMLLFVVSIWADAEEKGGDRAAHRWFSIPIHVTGLGADARFVPLGARIDFSDLLARLHVEGVVDGRSLRLFRRSSDGEWGEQPAQFTPDPLPRPEAPARLPDTPPGVSYLGEYKAGVTPPGLRMAGELTWIDSADKSGEAAYRLEFGVRRDGIVVQVPYPPQDLKVFDSAGRATRLRHFPRMQILPDRPIDGRIDFFDGRRLVTSYHLGPSSDSSIEAGAFRRPFFYPLLGPDGVPLTGFGKPHDPTGSHAHHYSLWIAHASVVGGDFWSEGGGVIVGDPPVSTESGPIVSRLLQNTRWMEGGRVVLRERRAMEVYQASEDFRVLDVRLELQAPGTENVTLGKTSFGFLAARVAPTMTVFDGGGEIVNSRGDRNERGAHLRRADWLDQSGPVAEGKWAGVAILDHPDNPNHPTVWHCRNDGWACASFSAEASYTIQSGRPLRLRYRILTHSGDAKEGEVARRYAEYSARPVVRFGEPTSIDPK